MGAEHKSQAVITDEIKDAELRITVGAQYRHYKDPNKTYLVKGFGTLEADDSLCVIYEAEYGDYLTFIRPVREWLEEVEWQGKTLPRFKKVYEKRKITRHTPKLFLFEED